jgi:hypothetical protein
MAGGRERASNSRLTRQVDGRVCCVFAGQLATVTARAKPLSSPGMLTARSLTHPPRQAFPSLCPPTRPAVAVAIAVSLFPTRP